MKSSSLKTYRRHVLLAAGLLMIQLIVGLAGTLTPQREIFPFASWFLFSLVPDRVVSYDAVLRGSDQRPLASPKPFNQAGGLVKSPHSVAAYQLIQQLGRALEAGRADDIRLRRRAVEAQFSSAPGMRYDVVRVAYRLAERWKGTQPPQTTLLASFHAGEDLP